MLRSLKKTKREFLSSVMKRTKVVVTIQSVLPTLQVIIGKIFFSNFTGKSSSEALLFGDHGENMLCTEIDFLKSRVSTRRVEHTEALVITFSYPLNPI